MVRAFLPGLSCHEAIDQVQDRFRSEGKRYNFVTRRQTQQRPPPPTPDNPGNGATATQTSSPPQTEPSQTQVAETPNEDINALRTDQPSTSTPREFAQAPHTGHLLPPTLDPTHPHPFIHPS